MAVTIREPIVQESDLLLTVQQPTDMASGEGSPRAYTPSAMDETTFTDANVAATPTVGQIVIPADGSARGMPRMVKSISSTTATVDATWPTMTTDATSVRAWRPGAIPLVTSGSGNVGGTTVVSAAHVNNALATDYWAGKGYFIIGVGGQFSGKASKVTGFTPASGTFTVATALGAQSAAGELFLLAKMLRSESPINASADPNFIKRLLTGEIDPDTEVLGLTAGNIAFELAVRGLADTVGGDTARSAPIEVGDLLQDHFTQSLDSSGSVSSAGTNTVTLAAGDGVNFNVGGLVLNNAGEVCQLRSRSTDTWTLGSGHQATASKVAASSLLIASAWYKRKRSAMLNRTFYYWRGGKFLQHFGSCMPSLELSISRNEFAKWKFGYMAAEVFQWNVNRPVAVDAAMPISIVDTTAPIDTKAMRCLIDGVMCELFNVEINWGLDPMVRPSQTGVNGSHGCAMRHMPITGRFRILMDNDQISSRKATVDAMMNQNTPVDLLFQVGSARYETFGVAFPAAQLDKASAVYDDRHGVFECGFEAKLPQAVPGNSYDAGLPAGVFGYM